MSAVSGISGQDWPAFAAALVTLAALLCVLAGAAAVRRFTRAKPLPSPYQPPVTVLRPLCGDEPLLEQALASICAQSYPGMQLVFGVQSAADPALLVVERIRARFPQCDMAVVVDAAVHGPNRKISNLMNMMPFARHDLLVFCDSDLHVAPDYLQHIVAALARPGAGLVTTVCTGLPTSAGWAARMGATGISHCFLPGALLSRMLGRQDCLGTTMALQRKTLLQIGGLPSLVRHLADDNVLAQRVRQVGLRVELAATVPLTAVPETSWAGLWQHELRWARTIRAMEPVLFATSSIQFPLFWALLACVLSGGAAWAEALFCAAWAIRAAAAWSTDWMLLGSVRRRGACPAWLLPARDVLSVAQVAGSFLGTRVVWRGHVLWADDGQASLATGAD